MVSRRCCALRWSLPCAPSVRAAKNGVVIATEKKLPTCLIDETSVEKIVMLTENIAIVYSGIGALYNSP